MATEKWIMWEGKLAQWIALYDLVESGAILRLSGGKYLCEVS